MEKQIKSKKRVKEYGVDILEDNVIECRTRLIEIIGFSAENIKIVEKNIVVADSTKYDFSFR